jgi:nitroimidazol reductase NimA-like FMN-containing flavoprotein (pyridoxamine 5'-phosphate oxidase superfamily)
MRLSDKKINDNQIIENILLDGTICRLSFVDGTVPYIVPVNYGYADGCLYIHSAPEGRKMDIIRKNNYVCFEVSEPHELITNDIPCTWSFKYRSVIGYGKIDIISDKEEKITGMNVIMARYLEKDKLIYKDSALDAMVVLKLTIDEMEGKQSGDFE